MPSNRRTVAWLLLLIWVVPGVAFAARKAGSSAGGRPEGPIQGVTVTTTCREIPKFQDIQTTDKKGMFTVDFREVDVNYVYRFDKPGYQTMQVEQKWELEGTQMFNWTMQPGQSAAVAGGAPLASTSQPAIAAYNAGVMAVKARDFTTAEAKFREAVGHDPNLRQGWEALTTVEAELGKHQETTESAEKAIALGSTDASVLTARWQAYRNLKDDAKAAEAQKDLERIGRQTEEAKKLHNEGVTLTKAGDFAGAFAKYQQALTLDPNLQASHLGLANAALKIGKNAEAASAAEAILKADPKNDQALRLRYNACLGLGDTARLIDALVGIAPIEPAVARNGLARLAFDAYDANDMALAKERFNKVLAVDPNYPQAYYYLAVIDVGEGATAQAKAHIERFLELAPNDKEAESAREMLKYLDSPKP
jgi:Tfp pilus assembly protein PilF